MINLSNSLNIEFLESMLNKTMPVLFEREKEKGIYEGHTTNYINVTVKSDINIINQILNVKLIDIVKEENMLGVICK